MQLYRFIDSLLSMYMCYSHIAHICDDETIILICTFLDLNVQIQLDCTFVL